MKKNIHNIVLYFIIAILFVYVCTTFLLLFVQDIDAKSNRLTAHLENRIGSTDVYIIHDKETDTDYIYTIDEREKHGAYGVSITTTSSIVQIDSKDKGE